jgi:hypothetical protein
MHFVLYLANKICLNSTEVKMLKYVAPTLNLGSVGDTDAASMGTVDWNLITVKIVIFGDVPKHLRLNVRF